MTDSGLTADRSIRVFVVEDHALVREGTAELLERDPGITVIGQAGSAEEALGVVPHLRPDVLLVDIELPDMNGVALVRALDRQLLELRALVVSAYDDYAYVMEALDAGVAGYLLKTASGHELADAVRTVAGGALVLDAAISKRLAKHWREPEPTSASELTPREVDVLQLLGRGMSNKKIATELDLGVRTVESHVSNILGKLGVSSRTEAALFAVSNHLVRPGAAKVT